MNFQKYNTGRESSVAYLHHSRGVNHIGSGIFTHQFTGSSRIHENVTAVICEWFIKDS